MGRNMEPIALIEAKGKTHMGEEERERRRKQELHPPFTDVRAPEYLTDKQAEKFDYYAGMLLALKVMTELDTDCLARYIIAHDLYIGYSKALTRVLSWGDPDDIQKIQNMQAKAFQQAQTCARDLGLTITSRCKITIPLPVNPEDDDL